MQAVRTAIDAATARQGRSRHWLAQRINLADSTLKRWYDGETDSFSLEKLVAIFETAGLSMDQAFGLAAPAPVPAKRAVPVFTEEALTTIGIRLDEQETVLRFILRGGPAPPGVSSPEGAKEKEE